MIFFLLTLLFLAQFHAGFSYKEKAEIINFFNKFMKDILDRDGHPTNNETLKEISVADPAKLLELVEGNVTKQILSSSKANFQDGKYGKRLLKNLFHKILMEKYGDAVEKNELEFQKKIKKPGEDVQFLLLLLSFCTRLAFTIGSEQLEKHHPNKISMDSFVLAYKVLDPDHKASYTLSYYQDAIIIMEPGSSIVSFNFTPVSDNFNTIHFYLTEKRNERVGKLIQLLKIISTRQPKEHWNNEYFMRRLMYTWATSRGKEEVFDLDSETFVAVKNFGANLAKLMLRNKEKHREYFEENENAEKVLNELLAELEKDAAEHRKTSDQFTSEQLMHYEDAIQIDWSTRKEFSSMAEQLKTQMNEWNELIKNCKFFEEHVFIDCNINVKEIKAESEKIAIPIKSFNLDGYVLDVDGLIAKFGDLEKVVREFNEIQTENDGLKRKKQELDEKHGTSTMNCLKRLGGCKELSKTVKKIEENEEKLKKLLQSGLSQKEFLESGMLARIDRMNGKFKEVFEEFNF